MKKEQRTLTLKSVPESFNQVEKLIEEVCDAYKLNHNYLGCLLTSMDAAFENAMVHGNNNNADKTITVSFTKVPTGVSFTVTDEGNGFDYRAIPDIKEDGKEKVFPGRGLFLIKSLTDDVTFNENGNEITLGFKTTSINIETSIDRIEKFQEYAKPEQKTTG
jgi:serine/threonine-protein kinase RsbW